MTHRGAGARGQRIFFIETSLTNYGWHQQLGDSIHNYRIRGDIVFRTTRHLDGSFHSITRTATVQIPKSENSPAIQSNWDLRWDSKDWRILEIVDEGDNVSVTARERLEA